MNKISVKKIILFLILFVIISIPLYSSLADSSDNVGLDAVLYNTSGYSSGTGTTLTSEGADVTGWVYTSSKYLQIDPSVPNDGNRYVVTLELAQELYIVANSIATPTGYESATFTKNSPLPSEIGADYTLKPYSGKVDYLMSSGQNSGTIQVELRYDEVIWNKLSGAYITDPSVKPIVVTISRVESNGDYTPIKEVSIKSAKSSSSASYGGYLYYGLTNPPSSTISAALYTNKVYFRFGGGSPNIYAKNLTFRINVPKK